MIERKPICPPLPPQPTLRYKLEALALLGMVIAMFAYSWWTS